MKIITTYLTIGCRGQSGETQSKLLCLAVMKENINILAIETSCDETAAAIVRNGKEVLSSVVSSQIDIHKQFGGVVPEIASRAHIERIYPVLEKVLADSGLAKDDIDAVAIANRPGLAVALIVGLSVAKTLAMVWDKPLIDINHIHAHLQSAIMEADNLELPAVALIVSGGHSSIYDCSNPLSLKLLGVTIDDAAGEAFDKVASILKLPYPGGPSIEKAAKNGNPKAVRFPRSMLGKGSLDFSFSGLKTAVLYYCQGQDMKGTSEVDSMTEQQIADIASSFQAAVVDVLVKKTVMAAEKVGAKSILLGGGVAANTSLRDELGQVAEAKGLKLLVAPKKYCTDNAVMVAALAYHKYKASMFADMTLEAKSSGEDALV